MPRNDGRLDPGQPLASAISARAWNRAQDAADIVLSDSSGFVSGGFELARHAIVVPISLSVAANRDMGAGYAIQIGGYNSGQYEYAIKYISGSIAEPRDLLSDESDATILPRPFGVTVEPMKQGQSVVRCAIAGLCVARVRWLSQEHRYLSLPTRRTSSVSRESLSGVLETSDTGYALIVSTNYYDRALIRL